jgi:hypothetical protein
MTACRQAFRASSSLVASPPASKMTDCTELVAIVSAIKCLRATLSFFM